MSHRVRVLLAAVATGSLLVGCSAGISWSPTAADPTTPASNPQPTASASLTEPTSPTEPVPSVALPTLDFPTAPPSSAEPAPSRPTGGGLATSSTTVTGTSGSVRWSVTIPTFSGGAAGDEATRRVRAAADDLIAQARREGRDDAGARRELTGRGVVVTNDGRTVQVTTTYVDYLAGTARPARYVTTTVVDVARARPVLFTQIVQNPPEAMRFLRTEVTRVAKAKSQPVGEPAGLAPKTANWAAWQSTPAGLVFLFQEYQLGGAGLRSYVVPWSRARLVLSSSGERLLLPR